jgi:hypothetical protein
MELLDEEHEASKCRDIGTRLSSSPLFVYNRGLEDNNVNKKKNMA